MAVDQTSTQTIVGILVPTIISFVVGVWFSPFVIKILNHYKLWRKQPVTAYDDKIAEKLGKQTNKFVPRFGGITIVGSVMFTILIFWVLSGLLDNSLIKEFNLVSRSETWLPIFALCFGFLIGFIDDLITVEDLNLPDFFKASVNGGLSLKTRLTGVICTGLICGWWFYFKLGASAINIPFVAGHLDIGWLIIPFIALVVVATYSTGVIDGVDGLAGGVFSTIFLVYGAISFLLNMYDLAAFCLVIAGGIYAFLWFNFPPAKFYMSETGVMALTLSLSLVAIITNTTLILPLVGLPLCLTSASVIIQVFSYKIFKRKFFVVSPLHDYFRAIGWRSETVTMRFWVVAQVSALSGLVVFLLGY